MARAKQEDDWNHTAAAIAWNVKMHVGKKASRLEPKHFHPFAGTRNRRQRKLSKEQSAALLNQLVGVKEHGRDTLNTDDGPGKVEHDGNADNDGDAG